MKRTLHLLALITLSLAVPACKNPADNARAGALADLAITYAARRGVISPDDAASLREAKVIILPTAPAAAPPPAGKQPGVGLQP